MKSNNKVSTSGFDAEVIRNKLKLRNFNTKNALKSAHPKALTFLENKGLAPENLRRHSAKLLGTGLIAGSIMLNPPTDVSALMSPSDAIRNAKFIEKVKNKERESFEKSFQASLSEVLGSVLPSVTRPLYRNEEKFLEAVVADLTGVKVRASLEGEHLNTTYGIIGIEQHLRRFPGDDLSLHGDRETIKEGIAPGLGSWGYFAPSKEKLSEDLVEIERWYAVVQTLYLPDWNTRQPYLKNWYKYRKVLIVNTNNGNAVVASIADSGPAAWTGKHFGGSPEVMDYLGGEKYKKGPVLVFFVDDPENEVPLGPVNYDMVDVDMLVSLN
ncbi:hypothetical protein IPM62_05815 [Candidatus Woesebacteria bacterium]|nr:MAG: hypothetical protein IPM62_05815 [Candidatus Woesebacteria bacterium]